MNLTIPASVEIEEGTTGQICVEISDRYITVERDVALSIMIVYEQSKPLAIMNNTMIV